MFHFTTANASVNAIQSYAIVKFNGLAAFSVSPLKTFPSSHAQARIAAMKGGGEAPTDAKPVPTSTNAPKSEAEKQGTVQKQSLFDSPPAKAPAVGLSSPFGTSGAGSGVFAGSSSFLDRDNKANTGDEAADWLEREKEQRDQRERARREEEER